MRLGINLGYWGAGQSNGVQMAQEAESLGFDSVWTAEAYGSDAVTPLTGCVAKRKLICYSRKKERKRSPP